MHSSDRPFLSESLSVLLFSLSLPLNLSTMLGFLGILNLLGAMLKAAGIVKVSSC